MADDIKHPLLLQAWMNRERQGMPSVLLSPEYRSAIEGMQKSLESGALREVHQSLQRFAESTVAQRLMGRMRPVPQRRGYPPTVTIAPVAKRSRKEGGGRKPKLTKELCEQMIAFAREYHGKSLYRALRTRFKLGGKDVVSDLTLRRWVVSKADRSK